VKEVSKAPYKIHPFKASGPDEYTDCFYQKYWKTVGDGICNFVLSFLNSISAA
jgi:hypothetical protein